MFLHIDDSMTIEEVQDRFSECFPFLSIAFYSTVHKRFEPSDKRFQFPSDKRIGSIRKNHYAGALEIKSWYSVAKVEKSLKDLYGLNVQIFRKITERDSVQTSLSDELTLQEQSELAYDPRLDK